MNQELGLPLKVLEELQTFMDDAERQIAQIRRRVIEDEKIPHAEKVFSLFERHPEWISKGKAGVPVELGLRVCILEDAISFILHHKVMQQETDDKVAVEMVTEAQQRFPNLSVCSFDKGFKRYVALAVLARNIQKLGAIKRDIERERERASRQKAA